MLSSTTKDILRPYQSEMIDAVQNEWAKLRATLVVAATGTGKTVVFLGLLDRLQRDEQMTRALVLVHKIDLTTQPLEKAAQFFASLHSGMGIVQAARNDVAARVIVATVQSLTPRRLELIKANGPISHIIVDEAHHAVAPIFSSVIDQFPQARVVGFTATPMRADARGLRGVFESIAYKLPIRKAIALGALVPPKVLAVGVGSGLKTAIEAENFYELVKGQWDTHCTGRQTVAFTSTIAEAERCAAEFRALGVPAAHISGLTPKAERERIRRALVAGHVRLVANAQVWTEGTDIPEISAMLILKAYTPHDGPFIQMVGRGLRLSPGKTDCIILDFNSSPERNLNLEGDLLGEVVEVEPEKETEELELGDDGEEIFNQLALGFNIDPAKLTTAVLDYLKFDALAWCSLVNCFWMSNLSAGMSLWIVGPDSKRIAKAQELQGGPSWTQAAENTYQHIRRWRLYSAVSGYDSADVTALGVYPSFEAAKSAGDDFALQNLEKVLSNRSARWRKEPASEAQLKLLRGLGRRSSDPISRGDAANEISWRKSYKSVETLDKLAGRNYKLLIDNSI